MQEFILDPATLHKLEAIPWFQNCGTTPEPPIPDALPVKNTKEAIKGITSTRWENMVLEFRGDFTEALCLLSIRTQRKQDRYWNPLTIEFKEKHLPGLESLWQKNLEPLGLWEKAVLDDIRFNVMAIATIDAFKDILDPPEFFQRLLAIYKQGHLPCGWKGKKNKGCFLVY